MPTPRALSMPTEAQVKRALKIVQDIDPNARILRIGPEGVTFDYQDAGDSDEPGLRKQWGKK